MYTYQKSKQQIKNEWSDAEKLCVLRLAGKKPIQDICARTGKNLTQVRNMCSKIGVSYAHPDNVKVR